MANSTTNTIYLVLRKDFGHHTDRKGHLAAPTGAYRTPAAANAAAKSHCEVQARKGFNAGCGEDPEHDAAAGLYHGTCYTREDRRDHFEVWVKAMKLQGGDDAKAGKVVHDGGSSLTGAATATKKRKSDVNENENGNGDGVGRDGGAKLAKVGGKGKANHVVVID